MVAFKKFNTAAVLELREAGIFTRDKNTTFEVLVSYITFVLAFAVLCVPGAYDIMLFVYYVMYDFGSSVDIYVEDHENGWTIWAFI